MYFFYKTVNQSIYGTESHSYDDEDGDPKGVIPFWSNTVYPSRWLYGYEEHNMILTSMPLIEFEHILSDMAQQEVIVGIEWNAQGVGVELPAAEVYNDLLSVQTASI